MLEIKHLDDIAQKVYKLQSMMIRKCFISAAVLLNTFIAYAQNSALQTFTLAHPYSVERIQPPKGKKVRNVILMIGDGMSLMHIQASLGP